MCSVKCVLYVLCIHVRCMCYMYLYAPEDVVSEIGLLNYPYPVVSYDIVVLVWHTFKCCGFRCFIGHPF